MHSIDLIIIVVYLLLMMAVGVFFMLKNSSIDDYYVGGRKMGSFHIGLSVVATDVGGGFSIGLGGLGFVMGLSGSWLLFTGLVGAWLSAVILIPRVHKLSADLKLLSFPQFLQKKYNKDVALLAGIVSLIGYTGFTGSQILAGAKLASSTFDWFTEDTALMVMGAVAILYTVIGGIKAVIYTDTIQWIVLLSGLIFVALPFSYFKLGGISGLREVLEPEMFSLTNVKFSQLVNWLFTIVPIWFIGMTLYQRIFATESVKKAKKAWYIAGLFEYPIMAFTGVVLGLFAKAALLKGFINAGLDLDPELGLPLMIKNILPVGLTGIVLASYFSAIMSTADSCLMAASGNLLTDIFRLHKSKKSLKYSQIFTFVIGIVSLSIAFMVPVVLDLMLNSYAFMVSGMLAPVTGALIHKNPPPGSAILAMITGGTSTLLLTFINVNLPLGLDPIVFGLSISYASYYFYYFYKIKAKLK